MFADKYFGLAMRNTLVISALKMFIGFPLPILFAVLLNEMNFQPLKKRFRPSATCRTSSLGLYVQR